MRRYRPLPAVVFAIARVRARRRVVRQERARGRRQDSRALQDVHRRAERDRDELRRQGRVRQPRLQRDPRHARHARSAFELLSTRANTRRCASGRKGATTASAFRSRRSTATSPRRSVFEGSPAYKKGIRRGDVISRRSRGEDAKGWTTEQAMHKLRGPKGTDVEIEIKRRGYEQLIPIRADARRGLHPDRARVFHDRRDDRLHPHAGLRREHRPRRQARAARSRRRRA